MQMQKKVKIFIGCYVLLIMLGVCWIVRTPNCYSRYIFPCLYKIPIIGYLVTYNFPSEDYKMPILTHSLSNGTCYTQFICKYEGRYQPRIKNLNPSSPYKTPVEVTGIIEWNEGKSSYVFNQDDSKLLIWYDNDGNKDYNYHYSSFFVPNQVPLNTRVAIKVCFSGDVDGLLKSNPNAKFEIIKVFDK